MPVRDFICESCSAKMSNVLVLSSEKEPEVCSCGGKLKREISYTGSYSIKGDNSASITPKRFRATE